VVQDWNNTYSLEIGNFITSATVGTLLLFGKGYPEGLLIADCLTSPCSNKKLTFGSQHYSYGWVVNMGAYLGVIGYSLITDSYVFT
jgi:hypothetical protein